MNLLCDRTAKQHYTDPATGKKYWSFTQVAQVLDPTVYEGIPEGTLAQAAERGTRLHYLCSFLLASRLGLTDPPIVPEDLRGYYSAIERWAEERQVVARLLEEPSIYQDCAGTPDGKVLYGHNRAITLFDLKTGRIRSRLHRVQVQVYAKMVDYLDCVQRVVVYVGANGSYEEMFVRPDPSDLAWFANGLNVLRGRQQGG